MKLLPKQRVEVGDRTDSFTVGLEAAVVLVVFFFAGFGLDRLFGTTPVFMIVMSLLGAVGLFVTYKYRYEQKMAELEAKRAAGRTPPSRREAM